MPESGLQFLRASQVLCCPASRGDHKIAWLRLIKSGNSGHFLLELKDALVGVVLSCTPPAPNPYSRE